MSHNVHTFCEAAVYSSVFESSIIITELGFLSLDLFSNLYIATTTIACAEVLIFNNVKFGAFVLK